VPKTALIQDQTVADTTHVHNKWSNVSICPLHQLQSTAYKHPLWWSKARIGSLCLWTFQKNVLTLGLTLAFQIQQKEVSTLSSKRSMIKLYTSETCNLVIPCLPHPISSGTSVALEGIEVIKERRSKLHSNSNFQVLMSVIIWDTGESSNGMEVDMNVGHLFNGIIEIEGSESVIFRNQSDN